MAKAGSFLSDFCLLYTAPYFQIDPDIGEINVKKECALNKWQKLEYQPPNRQTVFVLKLQNGSMQMICVWFTPTYTVS